MNNNRRRLLQGSLGLGLPAWALSDAVAQQGLAAAGGFDLVIFGGRVIDPSQCRDQKWSGGIDSNWDRSKACCAKD